MQRIASSHHPGFKPGHFATLMVIRLNPGLSQIEVCRAIGRDKSTLSPLIRGLERDGLILRENSSLDRRSVTLRLSPKGEETLDKLLEHLPKPTTGGSTPSWGRPSPTSSPC